MARACCPFNLYQTISPYLELELKTPTFAGEHNAHYATLHFLYIFIGWLPARKNQNNANITQHSPRGHKKTREI